MEFLSDLRLVNGLTAFFPTSRSQDEDSIYDVYLSSSEKKSVKNTVSKEIQGPFRELNIDCNEFFVKISSNLEILVKNSEFPNPEKYYRVKNFLKNFGTYYINEYITCLVSNKGDFGDVIFEAAFSDLNVNSVYFVCKEMSTYNSAFEEMKRKFNCEVRKKTKKWEAGHRYDTKERTYYYLGDFYSRRSNDLTSGSVGNIFQVGLYVPSINNKYTKVSEVIENGIFNEFDKTGIKVLYSPKAAVDSGKLLENDVTDIRSYWSKLIKKSIDYVKEEKNKFGVNVIDLSKTKSFLDIFSMFSSSGNMLLSGDDKKTVEDFLEEILVTASALYWGSTSTSELSSSNTIEVNSRNLVKLYIGYLPETYKDKLKYYLDENVGIFKLIGIDIYSIAERALTKISNDPVKYMKKDFETYLEFGSVYNHNRVSNGSFLSYQRTKASSFNSSKFVTIESLFKGSKVLVNEIINIVNNARDNFGIGVSKLYDTNVGTRRDPKIYTTIQTNIVDIIDKYGGASKVPSELVSEIIKFNYWRLEIVIDEKGELK